jgi:hypothetical protein
VRGFVPVDELSAHREARHRLTRLGRHRPVALRVVEARHRADELEVVGQRHFPEVAVLVVPGVVVESHGLENSHRQILQSVEECLPTVQTPPCGETDLALQGISDLDVAPAEVHQRA